MAEKLGSIRVCSLAELEGDRVRVVRPDGRRAIAVFYDGGKVYALDNRCPHMGFPLHRGSVQDGILTCHWHHAKFDLAGGCTFDPFADDVTPFPVEVRDGEIWLNPHPPEKDRRQHGMLKLREGLEQDIRLVIAKSILSLAELDAIREVVTTAALFGVRNRASGWSSGLSVLTAMANVLASLSPEDRPLALYQAVAQVAASTSGEPPRFGLRALETAATRGEEWVRRFRRFVEVRSQEAAERTLRTAVEVGLPESTIALMIFAPATDHLYLDIGHTLDFANKAFELLDYIGWEHAGDVLSSIVPHLVGARRMEESSSWRHPVDLPALLEAFFEEIGDLIAFGNGQRGDVAAEALTEVLLDGEPAEVLARLREELARGVPVTKLASVVAYAAARRLLHFPVSNEFGDWDTVHHTFTYANAVDQAIRRAPSALVARGIFQSAMSIYLDRFLNVPRQAAPSPSATAPSSDDVLASFDRQGQVDETGTLVATALAHGRHQEVMRTLGHAVLREDAGFHAFQSLEAGWRQYHRWAGTPAGDHVLVGIARFLTAQFPTVRSVPQTFRVAERLHRGEALHE
jgi:nitrite reductase/ring-hydroxylating ferredoxin subunit